MDVKTLQLKIAHSRSEYEKNQVSNELSYGSFCGQVWLMERKYGGCRTVPECQIWKAQHRIGLKSPHLATLNFPLLKGWGGGTIH